MPTSAVVRRGLPVLGVLAVVTGAGFLAQDGHSEPTPAPPRTASLPGAGVAGQGATPVRPVALEIPDIDVETGIMGLGLSATKELEVPPLREADTAGWYEASPAPGDPGPAVIVGHVDSTSGPAVFYELGKLDPGDTLTVTRSDRRTATFTVDRVATFAKSRFPTRRVYGATHGAELRLITCGGPYDAGRGGYQSNVVVFAHLTRLAALQSDTPREHS